MITSKRPHECTAKELHAFTTLVQGGGEVVPVGLDARIKSAESLLFLEASGCLKGIAAVKNPNIRYKERVFKKARASVESDLFVFELGWVFVHSSARGAGYSHMLVEKALAISGGVAMFATSRADNKPMHRVLKKHGFASHGAAYASDQGEHNLVLFIHKTNRCR